MTEKNIYLLAGLGLVGLLIMSRTSAASLGQSIGSGAVDMVTGILTGVAEAVPDAVNPASDQNIIYSTISKAGQGVSGDKYWTLGGAIYDWTH